MYDPGSEKLLLRYRTPCPWAVGDCQMHDAESANRLLRYRIALSFCGWALLASLLLAITQVLVADEHKIGSFSRAKFTTHPAWFKESFLDFEQDIAEATAQGKRLVLYFYQGFVYIKL